jgi:hypothetical protein
LGRVGKVRLPEQRAPSGGMAMPVWKYYIASQL